MLGPRVRGQGSRTGVKGQGQGQGQASVPGNEVRGQGLGSGVRLRGQGQGSGVSTREQGRGPGTGVRGQAQGPGSGSEAGVRVWRPRSRSGSGLQASGTQLDSWVMTLIIVNSRVRSIQTPSHLWAPPPPLAPPLPHNPSDAAGASRPPRPDHQSRGVLMNLWHSRLRLCSPTIRVNSGKNQKD